MSYLFNSTIDYQFETIPSTNDWAKEHLSLEWKNKLVNIYSHSQTSGRGQFNRKWVSHKDQSLTASWVFTVPNIEPHCLAIIFANITVSLLNAIGCKAYLKWPNDIYFNKKKMGGILIETIQIENHLFAVAGLGLNLNQPKESLNKIDQPAISLFEAIEKKIDPQDFFTQLSIHLYKELPIYFSKSSKPINFLKLFNITKDTLLSITLSNQTHIQGLFKQFSMDAITIETLKKAKIIIPLQQIKQL